jgi:hypothetical protein
VLLARSIQLEKDAKNWKNKKRTTTTTTQTRIRRKGEKTKDTYATLQLFGAAVARSKARCVPSVTALVT